MITGSDEYVKHNRTTKPCVYDSFKRAFSRQNIHFEKAIQSLDSLNDQIVQFIFAPKTCDYDEDVDLDECIQPKQREALKSSMALMRCLLLDAQGKFRKMVDDNKQLADRIDGDIQTAHQEVNVLRAELADTNRRINQLSSTGSLSPVTDNNVEFPAQNAVCRNCKSFYHPDDNQLTEEVASLKTESEKLNQENRNLQKEVEKLKKFKEQFSSGERDNDQSSRIQKLEEELEQAKETVNSLKTDRKRLKAEKFDLLNQMKQLYGTLEDKEKELRDFIRNYEQRVKESDESIKQIASKKLLSTAAYSSELAVERDATEREKWSILKHARDESERSVSLCAQLGLKESQLQQVQDELNEARKQLSQLGYYSDQESLASRSNGYHTSTTLTSINVNGRDHTPTSLGTASVSSRTPTPGDRPSANVDQITDGDGSPIYAAMSVCNESSPTPPMLQGLSRSAEELSHVLSTMDLKKKPHRRHGHKGTWGSISRVFSRSRSRRSVDSAGLYEDEKRTSWSPYTSLCASPLAEESYAEKLRLLEEAQNVPIERWKALTVVAWIELSLGMPQYTMACAENIKSGKILLELTDSELDSCLGMSNPMHRKKLRLAIEEFRDPTYCRHPKIGELTHMWVCGEWLPGLGLSQYVDAFANHLVDGRVLEQLGRKELEKYLGVSRKFHQISILHGIQLLRMICYDKQVLVDRRLQCEMHDSDPLVWTNQRFIKWATSIDLGEYAENLRESGVHGAFVILEPTFTADTMAAALGIPQSKNIIRRHLMTELEALIQPARCSLEQECHPVKLSKKGNNFSRSYASGLQLAKANESSRSSLRGSLSRALGLKVKRDLRVMTLPPPVPRHTTPGQTSMIDGGYQDKRSHRRARSTSDFDAMTVTSV